jgi:hypothetical protein
VTWHTCDPLAGKAAPVGILVGVPRPITAYYVDAPARRNEDLTEYLSRMNLKS